jgi:GxxExxY protein
MVRRWQSNWRRGGFRFAGKYRSRRYKGRAVGTYFADFIIDDRVILEIKCVTTVLPLFRSQMITYLRLSGKRLGLILNFRTTLLKDGIERVIL